MNRQEQMEMLKQEYQKIEIPEQALAAVQQGIRQAHQESRKPVYRFYPGRIAAAAVLAVIAVLNLSPQAAMAVADVPVLQKVVQIVTLNR